MKKLNINAIRIDGGTQARVEISSEVVADYAEGVKVGIEFPAVVVFHDGADYWLADGFHRYHGHKQAGKASVLADIRNGTQRDAVLFSIGANGTHGLRRTNADKRQAVETLLADAEWAQWSDRQIADAAGVSHPFVSGIRKPAPVVTVTTFKATKPTPKSDAGVVTVTTERAPASGNSSTAQAPAAPATAEHFGPSDAEVEAAHREQEEELATLRRVAESDDKLKAALAEVTRIRAENRILNERVNSLMNEKNAAIQAAKRWEKKAKAAEKVAA